MLGILVFFFGGIYSVVYRSNSEILKTQINNRMLDTAFHIMDKIDRLMFERYADIKTIASDPVISSRNSTPQQIRQRLSQFRNNYNTYVSLSFFDLNRIRIADTSGLDIGEQHPPGTYREDLLKNNDIVMDVSKSEPLNQTVFHFYSPVKDKNGETFGFVVTRMPITKLHYIIRDVGNFETEQEMLKIDLIDKEGLLLYSNYNRKGILNNYITDYINIKEALMSEERGTGRFLHMGTDDLYAFVHEQGYLDFKGNDWKLLVHIPAKVVFAPAVKLRSVMLWVLLMVIVFSVLIVRFLARKLTRPIVQLINGTKRIGKGDLEYKLNIHTKDEIGNLAAHFNEMTEKLKQTTTSITTLNNEISARKMLEDELYQHRNNLQQLVKEKSLNLTKSNEQLLHSEKLAAIGKLAASLAHEFNNPICGIKNTLELVANTNINDKDKELVVLAIKECRRMAELVRKLKDFNRPSSEITSSVNLREVIEDILLLTGKKLTERNITVENNYADNLPTIKAVNDQIKQVFLNLIQNAEEAIVNGNGKISITTDRRDSNVLICIKDNGSGIPPQFMNNIFEPFFTSKAAVNGSGLGLSVCHGIVKKFRGYINVESQVGIGTTFTVTFPADKNI